MFLQYRKARSFKIPLLFILLLFFAAHTVLAAKRIVGTIVDAETGEPIAYSSVYLKVLKKGMIADREGRFVVSLPLGAYDMEVNASGYKTEIINMNVDTESGDEYVTYKLTKLLLSIDSIDWKNRKDENDKAYCIMRQIMARVPLYERMFDSYKADIFIKGIINITRIPHLLRNVPIARGGVKVKDMVKKCLSAERDIEVAYNDPNKYDLHVKAFRTNAPKVLSDLSKGIDKILSRNVYGEYLGYEEMGSTLSPIRPGAFSYYKYAYGGSYTVGSKLIHRILFKSRGGSGIFSEGTINVTDGEWTLRSIEVLYNKSDILLQSIEVYLSEISPGICMPTAYYAKLGVNALATKGAYEYYASIAYHSIDLSDRWIEGNRVLDAYKITNNEQMLEVCHYLESRLDTLHITHDDPYLRPYRKPFVTKTRDSLANYKSEDYWSQLSTNFLDSARSDCFIKNDTIEGKGARRISYIVRPSGKRLGDAPPFEAFLMGHDYEHHNNTLTLGFDGAIQGLLYDLNAVDGWVVGQRFFFEEKIDKKSKLIIKPAVFYAMGRKRFQWEINSELLYAPSRRGYLGIAFGHKTNNLSGYHKRGYIWLNTIYTLFDGIGVFRLYDSHFASITNSIDLTNKLNLYTEVSYSDNGPLDNRKIWGKSKEPKGDDYSFGHAKGKDRPLPNVPFNHSLGFTGALIYNPTPYYHYDKDGRKEIIERGIHSPIFQLMYRISFPIKNNKEAINDYSQLSLSVNQDLRLGYYSDQWLYYNINMGTYLHKRDITVDQMTFLKTNNSILFPNERDINRLFHTLPPYSYVNSNKYVIARLTYKANRILLNRLPYRFFRVTDEQIHLKVYWGSNDKTYVETGYSEGLGTLLRLGVFVGTSAAFNDWGVAFRISSRI